MVVVSAMAVMQLMDMNAIGVKFPTLNAIDICLIPKTECAKKYKDPTLK